MTALLLPGCFNAPPPKGPAVDPELAQESAAARLALQRGANDQAVTLARRALNRARVMDEPAEIGTAAYNLAAALVRDGQYDAARAVLRDAEAETIRAGGNAADVLMLAAKVAQLQDEPTDALVLVDRVVTDKSSKPTDSHRVQVAVLRGEVAMDLGQRDLAQAELAKARKLLGGGNNRESPALRAGVLGLGGRVAQSAGDPTAAATQFDQQAEQFRRAGLYRDMARALARAAAAHQQAGQHGPAADRFYRAARSFMAQGDAAEADRLLEPARAAAARAGDADLIARIRVLPGESGADEDGATRPGSTSGPASRPAGGATR